MLVDFPAYLGEGVYREWKGRRGASICTEVERSWNPENAFITDFNVIVELGGYLGKRPPVSGSGKGSRGGG